MNTKEAYMIKVAEDAEYVHHQHLMANNHEYKKAFHGLDGKKTREIMDTHKAGVAKGKEKIYAAAREVSLEPSRKQKILDAKARQSLENITAPITKEEGERIHKAGQDAAKKVFEEVRKPDVKAVPNSVQHIPLTQKPKFGRLAAGGAAIGLAGGGLAAYHYIKNKKK